MKYEVYKEKYELRKFYNVPVGGCFKYLDELYIMTPLSCVSIKSGIIKNFNDYLDVIYLPNAKVVY